MRLKRALGAGFAVSLALAVTDNNQPLNVKIGLWQMTYTTDRNAVPATPSIPPELLAKMTPERRNRTEARLRLRAAQAARIETRQYCLTEDRRKKAIFDTEERHSCRRTIVSSTAKLQQFRDECIEAGTKRTAEGRFEAIDFDTMKGLVKVKAEGSNSFTMNVEIAGKWIAGDCGDSAQ